MQQIAPNPATSGAPKAPEQPKSLPNPALDAKPQYPREDYDWMGRHAAVLATKDALSPEVVLVGDSITHFWSGSPEAGAYGEKGAQSWSSLFGDTRVLNLGFSADRTQNVLWRLEHGELDGLSPRLVVLLIGTNNLVGEPGFDRACSPAEIAEGVFGLVAVIREKAPAATIVVMGVFPRGESPADPFRSQIVELNARLAHRCSSLPGITFLDIGEKFLAPDGSLRADLMPDFLHPCESGYALWADALAKVMKKTGQSRTMTGAL